MFWLYDWMVPCQRRLLMACTCSTWQLFRSGGGCICPDGIAELAKERLCSVAPIQQQVLKSSIQSPIPQTQPRTGAFSCQHCLVRGERGNAQIGDWVLPMRSIDIKLFSGTSLAKTYQFGGSIFFFGIPWTVWDGFHSYKPHQVQIVDNAAVSAVTPVLVPTAILSCACNTMCNIKVWTWPVEFLIVTMSAATFGKAGVTP